MEIKMSEISLTKNAISYIQKTLEGKEGVLGIRLGVKSSGCSGLSYTLDFATEMKDEDKKFESEGISVFVDPNSFEYLKGTQLDCVKEGLNEILKFNNPNVKSACGCGESFNTEK
jgi:iron-sulfur cluster assembly protein